MKRKKLTIQVLPLLLTVCLLMAGCGSTSSGAKDVQKAANASSPTQSSQEESSSNKSIADAPILSEAPVRTASSFPDYSGSPYAVINDNIPEFTESDLNASESYEIYGELDSLGRCTACVAMIGRDLMPTEERGSIGSVRPTGWHTVKYDNVDGKYLYNRCHLIGYQLTAENANKKNLITGTRYLNMEGMLPFENLAADYVKETGNHVLYRVTPIFNDQNLLASGVHMEAQSVEDNGDGVMFNIYCYNIQPGISIDYATGESHLAETVPAQNETPSVAEPQQTNEPVVEENTDSGLQNDQPEPAAVQETAPAAAPEQEEDTVSENVSGSTSTYVLNVNTGKFHNPTCRDLDKMSPENAAEFNGTRSEAIAQGYSPCGHCNP